jgi:integrase
MKEYKGKKYAVSCRQLREEGYEVQSDTEKGSYLAANLWWSRKRAWLDLQDKPAPRPLTEAEKLVFASQCKDPSAWEEAARLMDRAGATPEEMARLFRSVMARLVEQAEPETPCVRQHLPGHLDQVDQCLIGVGAPPPPSDMDISLYRDKWFRHQKAQVDAGQITAARVANNRTCLQHFLDFFTGQGKTKITAVDSDTVDSFYQHILKSLRKGTGLEGWSVAYAKDVFSVARAFIRYAAARCGACQLPRNIDDKFKFGSPIKKVLTWTPVEFMQVVSEAPGKLKLCLLLMANTGSTQQDVSDLLDEDVDWTEGRITRKRSKTKDKESVPTVSYKLWPETFSLLQLYRSGTERVLLTESRLPYVRTTLNPETGKLSKADGFASNYVHLKKRLVFAKPLKQLRKLGASLLAKHEVYGRFVGHFLGHSPRTVADRHYQVPPQDLFDQAVLWLGRQLGQME